ncbi:hypothetical protein CDD83_7361 [Cordyceps sp. RAO-2017]|nr:hypothetical protein CDD83_7361 [Cordyceps sp. RAO-2017]
MTETSSSTPSPTADASCSSGPQAQNPAVPTLPPLTTSPPSRRTNLARPMSHASKNRLSQYSTSGSVPSRSRPQSHAFPMYSSSLPYTLVRDFAYPASHPLHHGPPPEPSAPPSGLTTPASEHRRLSDPPASWEQRMPWDSWTADAFSRGNDIPPIQFGDGPPYSEDDDLQSPVVATRHRKHKSTSGALGAGRAKPAPDVDDARGLGPLGPSSGPSSGPYNNERGYYVGRSGDGGERYYVGQGGEANGPGGDLVTYPPDQSRQSRAFHFAHGPPEAGEREGYTSCDSSCPSSPGCHDEDQSRYSRDYQFTITSPDEEFHGKAVALYDFERENENELPLVEGQIIWVSYRHGQGWLVAEDPKTQESGLVPEEYVRLLRDIEGGMNSLTGQVGEGVASPNEVGTPTQAEHSGQEGQPQQASGHATNGYHQPVVSIFSTSSKDLNPYPTEQLGIQAGQAPPQVVHYHGQRGGSQANTPTISQHAENAIARRGSEDSGKRAEADVAAAPETSSKAAAKPIEAAMDTDR